MLPLRKAFVAVPDSARSKFSAEDELEAKHKREAEEAKKQQEEEAAAKEAEWQKVLERTGDALMHITFTGEGDNTARSSVPTTGRSMMSEWSREETVVVEEVVLPWMQRAQQLRKVTDMPRRVRPRFENLGDEHKRAPVAQVVIKPLDPFSKTIRPPDFRRPRQVAGFKLHKPLQVLQRDLRLAVKTRNYGMIAKLLHETVSRWPMSVEETSKVMEPALNVCCEGDDAIGIRVLVQAFNYIPNDITGEALYICAMRGNVAAGGAVLEWTTPQDRRRAFFRTMELRHADMARMILENDTDRTLLDKICSAGGGAHTILGKAVELAAEAGHLGLAQVALEHLFDPRVHVVPRNNDPREADNTHTERAQHWCWPCILRAQHIAKLRGHDDIAFLLAARCHEERPSAPSSPRMQDRHPTATSMPSVLGNHSIHRHQKLWHPSAAMSTAGSRVLRSSSRGGGGENPLGLHSSSIATADSLGPSATGFGLGESVSFQASLASASLPVTASQSAATTPGRTNPPRLRNFDSLAEMSTDTASTTATCAATLMADDASVHHSRFYHYGVSEDILRKVANRNDPNYVPPPEDREEVLASELGW